MKSIAIIGMLLGLSASTVYAHERPVKMSVSGTSGPSAVNLQAPGTTTGEDNFAGTGSLGAFTFRSLLAQSMTPDPSGSCPSATQTYFPELTGGGCFALRTEACSRSILLKGMTASTSRPWWHTVFSRFRSLEERAVFMTPRAC
jgi:hypothetical protein